MSIEIYYFSGTGNSYAVAKDIAERIKADVISIPRAMQKECILIEAACIGIVFPSYLAAFAGVPLIVERFVGKIANINTLRIFTVCTCGGYECFNALLSLKRLNRIIRSCGGRLSGEYSVRLPMNNLEYDHIPLPIVRDQEVIIDRSKREIEGICHRFMQGRGTKYKAAKNLLALAMAPFRPMIRKPVLKTLAEKAKLPADTKLGLEEIMRQTDRSIEVGERCTGCGTCARACPVGNIRIVDKRPDFQHRCEMCFACDEWCPSGAIRHWSRADGVKYHHPNIKAAPVMGSFDSTSPYTPD